MKQSLFFTWQSVALIGLLGVATVAVAQPNPVVYYSFNEAPGSTTLTDGNLDGGTAFNATFRDATNGPQFSAGILRGAWQGDGGAESSFLTDDITDLTGFIDVAVTAWVNPAGSPGFDGMVIARNAVTSGGSTQNWGINQQSNQVDARVEGGPVDSAAGSLPAGQWSHVALVYDGVNGSKTIYINGAEAATTTAPVDIEWTSGGIWNIGDDPCCGGREWAGLMDDVAIYNTFLSASDISTIYNNGLAGIALDGTVNLVEGDVDGDGDVDNDDLTPILDNLLDDVTGSGDTRPFGDLTGDGVVGLADFREWKDNFPTPTSSNAVPEPTSVALLGLAGLVGASMMRRRAATGLGVALLGASLVAAPASAQVVVTIDQDTGGVTVANEGIDTVLFDGYEMGSANTLLDSSGWASFTDVQLISDWAIVGTPTDNRFAEAFIAPNQASSTIPGTATPIDFGTAFDPSAIPTAQLAAGLGVEVRDVTFGYLEPGNDSLTAATVNYVGESPINNLVLKVDLATGNATLENESPFELTLDAFAITSASGALNASWAGAPSLGSPDWVLGSPDATGLSTVSPGSSVTVAASGGTLDFGDIFAGGDQDLQLAFLRVGEDDGDGFAGVVEYITAPLDGDYNNDGLVNAADYTVWRDNLGSSDAALNGNGTGDASGLVVQADYTLWANNFGAPGAGPSSASAVPEPTAVGLILVGLAGLACRRS